MTKQVFRHRQNRVVKDQCLLLILLVLILMLSAKAATAQMVFIGERETRQIYRETYEECKRQSSYGDNVDIYVRCIDDNLGRSSRRVGGKYAALVSGWEGTRGISWNARDLASAEQIARRECLKREKNCRLNAWVLNGCIAVGHNDEYNEGGYGVGPTKDEAINHLLHGDDVRNCPYCMLKRVICADDVGEAAAPAAKPPPAPSWDCEGARSILASQSFRDMCAGGAAAICSQLERTQRLVNRYCR